MSLIDEGQIRLLFKFKLLFCNTQLRPVADRNLVGWEIKEIREIEEIFNFAQPKAQPSTSAQKPNFLSFPGDVFGTRVTREAFDG